MDDFSSSLIGGTADHPETINANHMNMCRFSSKDDDGYRKVGGELGALVYTIQKNLGEEKLAMERKAEQLKQAESQ